MSNKPNDSNNEEELVITPGGPRPKDHVHSVGPKETVYVDESGNARVIPREQEGGIANMPVSPRWHDWESLGGNLAGYSPSAVAWGPNHERINCFTMGEDHALWHTWWA
jgi:hypothetical protein